MQLYLDLITIIPILVVVWKLATKFLHVELKYRNHLKSEAYIQGLLSNFILLSYQLLYDNDDASLTWVWKDKQVRTHVHTTLFQPQPGVRLKTA